MGKGKTPEVPGAALSHTSSLVRSKIGELSLVREIAECAPYLESVSYLSQAITAAVLNAFQVDGCGLFAQDDEGGWRALGGSALDPSRFDPEAPPVALLESTLGADLPWVMADHANLNAFQAAVPLRQGDGVIAVMVISDADIEQILTPRREILAIVSSQIAALLSAGGMYAELADTNRDLEAELAKRMHMLKDAEEQLHQREKLAALGQLVTGVTHELNNRLVPILGYAQLLKGLDLIDSAGRAVVSIENAALGSKQIVDDLLSFARPVHPNREPCALDKVLEEVVGGIEMAFDAPPVDLLVNGETPTVVVDPRHMEQVFHNLIKNALEAIEGKSGGHVQVTVNAHEDRVSVSVEDNGTGMPEEVQGRIFEPFFSTKGVGKGTGLGLSLTHGLTQGNGGSIRVVSRNGIGTRFVVTFPVRRESRNAVLKPSEAPAEIPKVTNYVTSHNKLKKQRLLVVEDEVNIREFLVQALSADYEISTAVNGVHAREVLGRASVDLVLMDLRMPEENGMKLFEWLQEHMPEVATRVVFMTGDSYDEGAQAFLRGQSNPHLAKPFTLAQLSDTLCRALVEL